MARQDTGSPLTEAAAEAHQVRDGESASRSVGVRVGVKKRMRRHDLHHGYPCRPRSRPPAEWSRTRAVRRADPTPRRILVSRSAPR